METLRPIEPVPVDDDLCTELGFVERVPMGARFVLLHRQTCYEAGSPILVVKRKIILPLCAIGPGIQMTLAFLASEGGAAAGQQLLRLVQ